MASVALVGRPNVGKSTLFNRLLGTRQSIVEPAPGVTRDRLEGTCRWSGREFTLIDTGGVVSHEKSPMQQLVSNQVDKAVEQSDLVLFVTSVEDGFTRLDEEVLRAVRKHKNKKPILLVVNKADTSRKETHAAEFFELGLGEPITVSALHGKGIGDLLDTLVARLKEPGGSALEIFFTLCAVGRPNVGKSSMVNALLGEPRVVVHESPGTTRDAVDTRLSFMDKTLVLVDTAGLRKRSKAVESVEYYSRTRTVEAISRADVALLVLEAPEGVLAQDKRIAGEIEENGKAVVIIANKWDKLEPSGESIFKEFLRHVRKELYFIHYAPVIPTSALTGDGIDRILPAAFKAHESFTQSLNPVEVKKVIQEATFVSPPPSFQGRRVHFKTMVPLHASPPTILLKTNVEAKFPNSYLNYLEGRLRESFDFEGTPLRFKVEKSGPKKTRGKKR